MAKPILVANWKNFPNSLSEAKFLVKELKRRKEIFRKINLFIAPPTPFLEVVKGLGGLAAQDLSLAGKGSHTGEVSAEILKSFGVRLAILGHSERRILGESSAEINKKIKHALRSGITPLICFGEREKDSDGKHFETLRDELKILLAGLSKADMSKIALAYEPVWAIGRTSKDAIEPAELAQSIVFIKKVLSDLFGRKVADLIPILYGGSVEPVNAGELMRETGVRGFLVGHASLSPKSFEAIVRSMIEK